MPKLVTSRSSFSFKKPWATSRESELFSHMDLEAAEEIRFLNLLGTIFNGPASTQAKTPQGSAGNMGQGRTDCEDEPNMSEPENPGERMNW